MAKVIAEQVVATLAASGFVIMRKPALPAGHGP
jgi:hypothetical protein